MIVFFPRLYQYDDLTILCIWDSYKKIKIKNCACSYIKYIESTE